MQIEDQHGFSSTIPDMVPGELPLHFSGVVVTYNEERHLAECLSALAFCSELVVVDLGSQDKSVEIAAGFGARVTSHEWVPAVEYVREFATNQAIHNWVVFMDPDLIFPTHMIPKICQRIKADPSIGAVGIPYRNFFLSKPVKRGRWGGQAHYPAIFRKDVMDFPTSAHRGFRQRPGTRYEVFRGGERDMIKHYWVDSIEHLFRKHRRYIPLEGPARYKEGERFSYSRMLFQVPFAVISSLFLQLGILDGWTGIYLSFFSGWWTLKYLLSLRDYQRQVARSGDLDLNQRKV